MVARKGAFTMSLAKHAPAAFVRPQKAGTENRFQSLKLSARLALDRQTKTDAYRLRHDSYIVGNYIDPMPNGLFSDAYDDLPNSQSLVVYQGKRPVASARVCVLDTDPQLTGWDQIPSARIFADEIAASMAAHAKPGIPPKAMEITRLVRHPDFADDFSLVFVVYRLIGFLILKHNADIVMSCCRHNHTRFYQRLAFEKIAGPRHYPGVKFETNLMAGPAAKYGDVAKFVGAAMGDNSHYAPLLDGETVPVFQAA